jgi:hypothetical protein
MSYECYYCEGDSEQAHSITIYNESGSEDRLEVLCDTCYEEWLLSLKG